jgi:uncharacterized protein (DUF433 family)
MLGFDRITFDPNILGGRACIRGMRISVSLVLNLVANGMSVEEIVKAYPYLEPEDIRQTLQYAAWLADESIDALEQTSA